MCIFFSRNGCPDSNMSDHIELIKGKVAKGLGILYKAKKGTSSINSSYVIL